MKLEAVKFFQTKPKHMGERQTLNINSTLTDSSPNVLSFDIVSLHFHYHS